MLYLGHKEELQIIDYSMKLDRSFIYSDRSINFVKMEIEGKFLYMYEDTMMRSENETNPIIKIGRKQRRRMI